MEKDIKVAYLLTKLQETKWNDSSYYSDNKKNKDKKNNLMQHQNGKIYVLTIFYLSKLKQNISIIYL
ncbi:hypothetical protein [Spiroplasma endosymbiont of Nebria brevicollis]|uniref:hypothetical protein n=1 Tax=Spiroplasma endosymbiont of Nebria brevicollis TaxID=3066284 RepID=UPI00313AC855